MAARKPISQKRRFDIFKRDMFTCTYCGRHPPAVLLEVDHIVPVSKGGNNGSDNLTTSCFDCNRGKGANELSVIPESLNDKALRIKTAEKQLRAYRKEIQKQADRIDADIWDVIHALYGDDCNETAKAKYRSIKTFLNKMDKEDVIESADIAGSKFYDDKAFKYFCGICWNKIKTGDNYAEG